MDKIRIYMHEEILVTPSETSAKEVACIMKESSVSSLLVMEKDDYVGIVTHRDMSEKLVAEGLDQDRVTAASLMESVAANVKTLCLGDITSATDKSPKANARSINRFSFSSIVPSSSP